MDHLNVKISDGKYIYGNINIENDRYVCLDQSDTNIAQLFLSGRKKFKLDAAFVHYLTKELRICDMYRKYFIKNYVNKRKLRLLILLRPTKKDLIDYNWNERVYLMVRERCEVNHAFSWLSTLGGAFSALGDYFENCAETAGKISLNQLKLAFRLSDPTMESRCRLYLALSLIQKKRYRPAKKIIEREYRMAKSERVVDNRLVKMCLGIWSKLQYEHYLYVKDKKAKAKYR